MAVAYLWAAILAALAVAALLARALIRLKNERITLSGRDYWSLVGAALLGIIFMVLYASSN